DQGRRLDVALVDVFDNPGGRGRGVRLAAVRVGEHNEEQQQHHEDRNERPAEVTLEIHRSTTPPAPGGSLLTSLCYPPTSGGPDLHPSDHAGFLSHSPVKVRVS